MAAALHGLADLTPLTFSQLRLKLGAWHFCCVAEKASFKTLSISFCWKLSDFRNSRGRFSCTKLATSCPKGPWPSKTPTSWHMKSQGLTPRTSANMTKYDKIWQIYLNISEHSLPAKEVKSRWMRPWMTKVLKWQDLCEKRKSHLDSGFLVSSPFCKRSLSGNFVWPGNQSNWRTVAPNPRSTASRVLVANGNLLLILVVWLPSDWILGMESEL